MNSREAINRLHDDGQRRGYPAQCLDDPRARSPCTSGRFRISSWWETRLRSLRIIRGARVEELERSDSSAELLGEPEGHRLKKSDPRSNLRVLQ
jgi:hypothetical protein